MSNKEIAGFLALSLLLGSCASTISPAKNGSQTHPRNVKEWMNGQSRAKKGAIVGSLLGAVTGAVIAIERGKNPWEGAAAGAVGGAIVGFAIGRSQDKIYANRDDAIRTVGYNPAQGYLARVEEIKFIPSQPRPGQTASLYVRYLVVGPNPNEEIKVRMFRGLKYGDDYIVGAGPNEFTVPRGGGIVESTMPITLPAKVPQGTYGLEALLEDPAGRFPQALGTSALYLVGLS